VIAALRGMAELDAEIIDALEGLFARDVDRDLAIQFLRAVTAQRTGRYVASEVLGQRSGS
jgi:hypothetical protein